MTNEPHAGYIGMPTLHAFDYYIEAHLGPAPSPVQGFALGSGHPIEVPVYTRAWPFPSRWTHNVVLNEAKESAWLASSAGDDATPSECAWAREGVWAWNQDRQRPTVLKEGYFSKFPCRPNGWREGIQSQEKCLREEGGKAEFYRDFYWPFVARWQELIRSKSEEGKMVHVETVPNQFCPDWPDNIRPKNLVFSPHWYDLNVLFNKSFGFMSLNVQGLAKGMFFPRAVYFGDAQTKDNYTLQIGNIVRAAHDKLGEVPVVIGETGFPMDMNGGEAFKTGNFRRQERMMDALMTALERNMVAFNLWTYNPSNTDEVGDDWNYENFSWFSHSQLDPRLRTGAQGAELDQGCRLNRQVVRPYALRTAGIPLKLEYQSRTGAFFYQFANPAQTQSTTATEKNSTPAQAPPQTTSRITEIFLPPWLAEASSKGKLVISCSDGTVRVDETQLRVFWTHEVTAEGFVHEIRIRYKRRAGMEGIRPFWWLVLLVILSMLVA
ncbi:hypothetical protein QFC24_004492 [Naganishia onofrii]|uniref:Uncharacterized protein n=1 Tax=Naganishia onofrii TaxID=1851511 RepID=A0ACC2XE83_9TREE|nr:hypothetical protein QFC24_004492 [Naganishia onofrii]